MSIVFKSTAKLSENKSSNIEIQLEKE